MFRMHYWSNVLSVLKKVGAEVVVTGVPGWVAQNGFRVLCLIPSDIIQDCVHIIQG